MEREGIRRGREIEYREREGEIKGERMERERRKERER